MQQLPLDLDVLGLVCESLNDAATVLSFSLVSHALRPVALKHFLAMKAVVLKDERTIRAFHEFVATNLEPRVPVIRALRIEILKLEEHARLDVVRYILDLLERTTHLESLTLLRPEDTFKCLADPRVSEAIARVPTLRELGLLEGCHEMETIVKSTRSVSSLRILRLSLMALPDCNEEDSIPISEFDALLGHFASTLEVLDITERTLLFDEKGLQYPAPRSLKLGVDKGIVRMETLTYKFPALDDSFSIGTVFELQHDLPKQWRIREANKERQLRRSWTHLDHVTGDVLSVFVLGLTCPVRHIMLDTYNFYTTEHIADILRTAPPTHLKLAIVLCYGPLITQDLFPGSHAATHPPRARTVFLRTNRWILARQAKIIESVRTLRLTHLHLRVQVRINLTHGLSYPGPYSKDFVRDVATLDPQQIAMELMNALPSLHYIFLNMRGHLEMPTRMCKPPYDETKRDRWQARSAWRNMNNGLLRPSANPEKLGEDVMERMILDEDLILSEHDEVSDWKCVTVRTLQSDVAPLPE
ncbi:hypothetical protein VTO73DRAFT_10976 [Trametes versicolor]